MKKRKQLTQEEALGKLRKWSAYQERSPRELRGKIYELGFRGREAEELEEQIVEEEFVDEVRFAKAYARGRFRIKRWGRMKIRAGLMEKGVGEELMVLAMAEINEEEYQQTLQHVLRTKWELLEGEAPLDRKAKLVRFAQQRGFETGLIWEAFGRLQLDDHQ